MKMIFEKIRERLQNAESVKCYGSRNSGNYLISLTDAINIINKIEAEYNNGWISVDDRLPKDDSICIVTVEYPNNETMVDYGWFDRMGVCWYVGMQELRTSNVLAWQPLPEPYTPKGE